MDRTAIIGALQAAGTRDPDVLHARMSELRGASRVVRSAGWLLLAAGVVVMSLVNPLWLGSPLIAIGAVLRHRGARNIRTIESGYAEFVKSPAR